MQISLELNKTILAFTDDLLNNDAIFNLGLRTVFHCISKHQGED